MPAIQNPLTFPYSPINFAAIPSQNNSKPNKPSRTGDTQPIEPIAPNDTEKPLIDIEPADPLGWSEKQEQSWIDAVATDWVNPGLTATVYDEGGQVLSYRRSGSPITHEEIVWFGSTPIARFTSSGTTITAVHTIYTDHLNSPRALSNARAQGGQTAGLTVWTWDLVDSNANGSNAFGSLLPNEDVDANGSTVKFDLRFPGQQYDAETQLSYNYFRDYESGTGRYVESDPIGLDGGISTFGYVGAMPTRTFDSTGLAATMMSLDEGWSCFREFGWDRCNAAAVCRDKAFAYQARVEPNDVQSGKRGDAKRHCFFLVALLLHKANILPPLF